METNTENVKSQLEGLVDIFVKRVPARIAALERAYRSLQNGPVSRECFHDLRLVAHKLAGSAATFGFANVSTEAKRLEDLVSDALDRRWPPSTERVELFGRQLLVLEEKCSMVDSETGSEILNDTADRIVTEGGHPRHKPIVIMSARQDADLDDLAGQLGFFGFRVKMVHTTDELEATVDAEPDQLAILHTDVFEGADVEPFFDCLKRRCEGRLSYVFVSERSDFPIRLKALRSGGDAFFVMPLDVARLIDMLDELMTDSDSEPYHILIVDDDQEQVSYYALVLQQAGMITSVASDPKTVLNVMVEAKPELILMDMYMPGCSGTELLTIIRQQEAFVSIPIVFLSVEGDDDKKISAIRYGGDDFITKPADPEFLVASITNRVQRTRNMRYFMERDSLTGLLNHSNLREQLIREILRAERSGAQLCFAMIDLDKFKDVNDMHGHLTGDKVLKSLSRILQERLRRTDIIGRYGGEEFGVVMLNTAPADAQNVLNEIRRNFSHVRHQSDTGEFYVTFSCGIASFPGAGDANQITVEADRALYAAKEGGRNRVVINGEE